MNKTFLTVRHFHDENALRTYGQDGPLKLGQEKLLQETVQKVYKEFCKSSSKVIRIITTTKTRRLFDTANMLADSLRAYNIEVTIKHDPRLEVMDQGSVLLPDDYQDGEWFDPLDVAWDAICDEAYGEQNIFYQFGDHLNGKYQILKDVFSQVGESMGDSLINKYGLIYDLAHHKLVEENELLVLVAQSDLPLVLMELQALVHHPNVTAENLPYQCWDVYKQSGLQESMYDYTAHGDGNFDIPMGYIGVFDLSNFIESGFDIVIKMAQNILKKIKNKK